MATRGRYADFDPVAPRRGDVQVTLRAVGSPGSLGADDADHTDDDLGAAARLAVGVYGGDPAAWARRLTAGLHRPGALVVVAEVDGRVVGYGKAGWCTPSSDDDPAPAGRYLTGLVVDPAWRRCGAGRALTRWRLQRIHADGQAAWFFANARNTASIALHADLGFVEVARAGSYLGEPFDGGVGVLMRCEPPTGAPSAGGPTTSG